MAVEQEPILRILWDHFLALLLLGTSVVVGMRPPWSVNWLALPMIPFVLVVWAMILIGIRKIPQPDGGNKIPLRILLGVIAFLCLGFIFTSFGVDPSGRYFLPINVIFALLAGLVLNYWRTINRFWAVPLVVILAFQGIGLVQCSARTPPGFTTQFYQPSQLDMGKMNELIDFLNANKITRGYSNYWISYPLAFLSHEKLIFTPELPYHSDLRYTNRDNRYAPYQTLVDESRQIAYISSKNPALDERLESEFSRAGIAWETAQIGDFKVYYHLSAPIRPDQIDLRPSE